MTKRRLALCALRSSISQTEASVLVHAVTRHVIQSHCRRLLLLTHLVQICQFCYHNVRNNINGLCPACRRPYDDATIEFRKPSPEEYVALLYPKYIPI